MLRAGKQKFDFGCRKRPRACLRRSTTYRHCLCRNSTFRLSKNSLHGTVGSRILHIQNFPPQKRCRNTSLCSNAPGPWAMSRGSFSSHVIGIFLKMLKPYDSSLAYTTRSHTPNGLGSNQPPASRSSHTAPCCITAPCTLLFIRLSRVGIMPMAFSLRLRRRACRHLCLDRQGTRSI